MGHCCLLVVLCHILPTLQTVWWSDVMCVKSNELPCIRSRVLKSYPQALFISIRWLTWRNCQQNIRRLHESLNCHSLAEETALMKIMIAQGKVLFCLRNRLSPLQKLANLTPEKGALTIMIDLCTMTVVDRMQYFILFVFMAASV